MNPLSLIVRERLAQLGLAQLPPAAVAHLEAKLIVQLRKAAAKRITAHAVAQAILAAAQSNPAPKSAEKGSDFHKPLGA